MGYSSLQFLRHSDMACGRDFGHGFRVGKNGAIEIVDLHGNGKTPCGSSYRAGWEASSSCNCDEHKKFANCEGYDFYVRVQHERILLVRFLSQYLTSLRERKLK